MRPNLGKLAIGFLWVLLLGYSFTLAPANDSLLTKRILAASIGGSWDGIDPSVIAVWNMLGLVPLLYLSLLIPDGRRQRVWSWPFGLLMMMGGAFVLVPWLLLRTERDSAAHPYRMGMMIVRSAVYRWGIVCGLLGLTVFGVLWGNAEAYLRLFWSKRLIHVMTLDLLFCAALLPYLIGKLRRPEDIEQEPSWAKALLWLPLFGPALWNALCYRPATLSFQPDQ
jgi:hypothetical protein